MSDSDLSEVDLSDLVIIGGVPFERELFDDIDLFYFTRDMFTLAPRNRHIIFVDNDVVDKEEFISEYLLSHGDSIRTQQPSETNTEYIVVPIQISGPNDLASRNLETECRVEQYMSNKINIHKNSGRNAEDTESSPFFGLVTSVTTDNMLQAIYKKESETDRAIGFIAKLISIFLLAVGIGAVFSVIGKASKKMVKLSSKLGQSSKKWKYVGNANLVSKKAAFSAADDNTTRLIGELGTAEAYVASAKTSLASAVTSFGELSTQATDARLLVKGAETSLQSTRSALRSATGVKSVAEAGVKRSTHLRRTVESIEPLPESVISASQTFKIPPGLKGSSALKATRAGSSGSSARKLVLPKRVRIPESRNTKGITRAAVSDAFTDAKVAPKPKTDASVSVKDATLTPPPPPGEVPSGSSLDFIREGIANYDKVVSATEKNLKLHYFKKLEMFQPTSIQTEVILNYRDNLRVLKKQLDAVTGSSQRNAIINQMSKATNRLASALNRKPFNEALELSRVVIKRV